MNFYQYVKRHLIFVVCLLVIGYGIVAYIHIVCPQKIDQSPARGAAFDFAPVYNEREVRFMQKWALVISKDS